MSAPAAGPLKKTPLNEAHRRHGAKMVEFGGWDMPVDYGSQIAEHEAVRNKVGMFDVSHMGQVRFRGERTLEFLNLLVPGNIGKLVDGGSVYTTLCRPNGGVVDDLIITRMGAAHGFTVVNASTKDKDFAWMLEQKHAMGYHDVKMTDESDQWGMIAVQGPEALALCERLVPGKAWSTTKAFTMHEVTLEGKPHLVSRTGYTGESGIELLCPADMADMWWERFAQAGVKPCGLGARDSLRLEMGYCLYGQDLADDVSPIEGGISWTISFKKPEKFIGRDVLEKQKAEGAPRMSVGLKLDSRRPLRHGDKVSDGTRVIGEVTSGGYSITLGVGIAMALVDRKAAEGKDKLFIEKGGKLTEAAVTKPPFVQVKSKPVK